MSIPVTIALLTYNRSGYLKEAIEGVLSQTYRNFEFLILDNGSTDDTPDVVLSIKDDRIRYVRNPPGYTAPFNGASAIKIARGERVIATHDDDIMMPTMLEKQMALMDAHPGMTAVWTNVCTIDKDGAVMSPYLTAPGPDRIYERGEYIVRYPAELLWPLPSTLIFCRKKLSASLIDSIYYKSIQGGKPPKSHGGLDILIPSLLNTHGAIGFLNEPLLKYRLHGPQDSHQTDISLDPLNTYTTLYKLSRKIPQTRTATPFLRNFALRYKAQHVVINTPKPALAKNKISGLEKDFILATQDPDAPADAFQPLLPLSIFLSQSGCKASAILGAYRAPGVDQPRVVQSLFQWIGRRKRGENLFQRFSGKTIAILGSALISALLVNEAREAGASVAYCLDSNIRRQGRTMLGVPIYPPTHLSMPQAQVDCVILSSEREHDKYLVEMIRKINGKVEAISWKDLT